MADIRTLVGAALALMVLATVPTGLAAAAGGAAGTGTDPVPHAALGAYGGGPVLADKNPTNDTDDDWDRPCEDYDLDGDGITGEPIDDCAPIAPSFGDDDINLVAVGLGGNSYVGGDFDASRIYVDGDRIGRQAQRRHTEPPVDDVAAVNGRKTVQPRDLEFVTPDGRIDVSKVERARENGRKTVKARDA